MIVLQGLRLHSLRDAMDDLGMIEYYEDFQSARRSLYRLRGYARLVEGEDFGIIDRSVLFTDSGLDKLRREWDRREGIRERGGGRG